LQTTPGQLKNRPWHAPPALLRTTQRSECSALIPAASLGSCKGRRGSRSTEQAVHRKAGVGGADGDGRRGMDGDGWGRLEKARHRHRQLETVRRGAVGRSAISAISFSLLVFVGPRPCAGRPESCRARVGPRFFFCAAPLLLCSRVRVVVDKDAPRCSSLTAYGVVYMVRSSCFPSSVFRLPSSERDGSWTA
jgi:hypothetical protein